MDYGKSDQLVEPAIIPHKSEDKGNWVLYYHCIMIGVGVLTSWNAISTAFDWMNTEFSGMQASLVFTLINFIPNLIFMPLTVRYGYKYLFNTRIIIPFFVLGGMLAIIPPIVLYTTTDAGYGIMCVLVFVLGAFNAVAQTSVFSLAATLPGRYTGAVMVGNGVSGVLINIVRMICLALLPDSLTMSTVVYFIIAGLAMALCIVSQWFMMRNSFVIESVAKTSSKVIPDPSAVSSEKELTAVDGQLNEELIIQSQPPKFITVMREIWQYSFLVFMCYLITFGMYPTACISAEGK